MGKEEIRKLACLLKRRLHHQLSLVERVECGQLHRYLHCYRWQDVQKQRRLAVERYPKRSSDIGEEHLRIAAHALCRGVAQQVLLTECLHRVEENGARVHSLGDLRERGHN